MYYVAKVDPRPFENCLTVRNGETQVLSPRIAYLLYVAADNLGTHFIGIDCSTHDFQTGTCDIQVTTATINKFDCTKEFYFFAADIAKFIGDDIGVVAHEIGKFDAARSTWPTSPRPRRRRSID